MAILIVVTIGSAALGCFLIWIEIRSGGMQERWTYHGEDANGVTNSYRVQFVDTNGATYALENKGAWGENETGTNIIALDQYGHVMWRAPVNGWPLLEKGADGGFFYTNWNNGSGYLNESSRGNTNLTYLDSNGDHRWSYLVNNGSVDVLVTYPDGQVIARHQNYQNYNETSNSYEDRIDEIIALSSSGDVLWRKGLYDSGNDFWSPSIAANGTFLIYTIDLQDNISYELGFDKAGGTSYIFPLERIPRAMETGQSDYYEIRREGINETTSFVYVVAYHDDDQTYRWKTVIGYTHNHDNLSDGSFVYRPASVDGNGIIYGDHLVGDGVSFALNANGQVLWTKPYIGTIIDTYLNGGVLVQDGTILKKINIDGSTAWEHTRDVSGGSYYSTALGPDGTVVLDEDGGKLVALAHSNFSINLMFLTFLFLVNAGVLIWYLKNQRRKE